MGGPSLGPPKMISDSQFHRPLKQEGRQLKPMRSLGTDNRKPHMESWSTAKFICCALEPPLKHLVWYPRPALERTEKLRAPFPSAADDRAWSRSGCRPIWAHTPMPQDPCFPIASVFQVCPRPPEPRLRQTAVQQRPTPSISFSWVISSRWARRLNVPTHSLFRHDR